MNNDRGDNEARRGTSAPLTLADQLHIASFVGNTVIEDVAFAEAVVATNLMAVAMENQIAILELRSNAAVHADDPGAPGEVDADPNSGMLSRASLASPSLGHDMPVRTVNQREYRVVERERIICDATITHLAWSPASLSICAVGEDLQLRRFDKVSSSAARHPMREHVASEEELSEQGSWEEVFCVSAHSQSINACSFSLRGDLIATCSDDGTVKIFDAASGRICTSYDFLHPVSKVLWSRNTQEPTKFFVADVRGKIRVYNFGDVEPKPIQSLSVDSTLVDVAAHPRASTVLACITKAKWYTFDTSVSSLPVVHAELEDTGTSIAWAKTDPDVLLVGTASAAQVTRLGEGVHDVIAMEPGETTCLHPHPTLPLAFAAMGNLMVLIPF